MMSGKRADRRAADQWHTRQANHDDEDGCERRTHIHIDREGARFVTRLLGMRRDETLSQVSRNIETGNT